MNWNIVVAALPDGTRQDMKLPAGLTPRAGEYVTLENRLLPNGDKEFFIVESLLWQTGSRDTDRFALLIVLGRAPQSPGLHLVHPA